MGCIHSKKNRNYNESISSSSPSRDHLGKSKKRIFDVETHNTCDRDVNGFDSSTSTSNGTPLRQQGQLEITDENLIYRTRGRNPIIWPLRFLRQYGKGEDLEKDIFSFECGRHCSTGPGVFVFRCSETEQLFSLLLQTINKTSSQQQTLNHSISQQSNTSRTGVPITSANNHQQYHFQTSQQHSDNDLLREYVNIPPVNGHNRNNVPSSSVDISRPRSSLDQRSHFTLPSKQQKLAHDHFEHGAPQTQRSSFDSATLPNRRSSVSNHLAQSSLQQQATIPLYVNSQSFDIAEINLYPRKGNSSSFDDVSAYTNVQFFNQQVNQDLSSPQSQKPNYIQLDLVASNDVSKTNRNLLMNGAKSLSNLSRGGSPQRMLVNMKSGSSNSLNRNSPKHPLNFSNTNGRSSQNKITLDTPVPLPAGLSYVKIDFERTAALTQLNHNRQQLAVNGNYC